MIRSVVMLALFFAPLLCYAQNADHSAESKKFDAFVDRVFDRYLADNPSQATSLGVHDYDARLEDYSPKAQKARRRWCYASLDELDVFNQAYLNQSQQIDARLIKNWLRSQLLELEEIRMWQRNPDEYSSGVASAAFVIMSRNYAAPQDRLRALIAREQQMPAMFAAARVNLQNPPHLYTEIALEQLPGIVSFFANDVPTAFAGVQDEKLQAEFKKSNAKVLAELESYGKFLKDDLLPRSKGDYRIGADKFSRKLRYEEMIETPLSRLLQIGEGDLRHNQQEFVRVAKLIDPTKTPEQILVEAEKDHPTAENLLPTFRQTLEGERRFIEEKKLATIPSPVLPIVEETPAFMRALTSASMDTPGPWEKVAKEAYFNVTLPEKSWDEARTRSWLEGFNRGTITSTSVHEAYPGHYVQFLVLQQVPLSRTRRIISCNSNAEGWAHYSEQMMLDEGYGRTPGVPEERDVSFLKLRLGQLQDALLRNARLVVGIKMHTGKMSFEQGVTFFEKEGRQTHEVAVRETMRGTSDPTYLVYTVGKLEIMKLREDYRRKQGAAFSLGEFHDRLLEQGAPPLKIVREILLGDDSPAL